MSSRVSARNERSVFSVALCCRGLRQRRRSAQGDVANWCTLVALTIPRLWQQLSLKAFAFVSTVEFVWSSKECERGAQLRQMTSQI